MKMNRWLGLALGLGLMIAAAPNAQAQSMTFDTVPPAPIGSDVHEAAPGHAGKVAVMKRNGKVVYVPMNAARNMERAGAGQIVGAVDPNLGQPGWQQNQPAPWLGQNPEGDDDGEVAADQGPRVKKGKKDKRQYQAGSVRQGGGKQGKGKKNR